MKINLIIPILLILPCVILAQSKKDPYLKKEPKQQIPQPSYNFSFEIYSLPLAEAAKRQTVSQYDRSFHQDISSLEKKGIATRIAQPSVIMQLGNTAKIESIEEEIIYPAKFDGSMFPTQHEARNTGLMIELLSQDINNEINLKFHLRKTILLNDFKNMAPGTMSLFQEHRLKSSADLIMNVPCFLGSMAIHDQSTQAKEAWLVFVTLKP